MRLVFLARAVGLRRWAADVFFSLRQRFDCIQKDDEHTLLLIRFEGGERLDRFAVINTWYRQQLLCHGKVLPKIAFDFA